LSGRFDTASDFSDVQNGRIYDTYSRLHHFAVCFPHNVTVQESKSGTVK